MENGICTGKSRTGRHWVADLALTADHHGTYGAGSPHGLRLLSWKRLIMQRGSRQTFALPSSRNIKELWDEGGSDHHSTAPGTL